MMTSAEFVRVGLERLKNTPTSVATEQELGMTADDLRRMHKDGFIVEEAVALMRCMEHFNPDLDEDIALARMASITATVKARVGKA